MPSPAKRRKKNDFQSSPQTVRSLDFFFGKQKEEQILKAIESGDKGDTPFGQQTLSDTTPLQDTLTDEQYARQLQQEWNNQDARVREDGDQGATSCANGEAADVMETSNGLGNGVRTDASVAEAIIDDATEPGRQPTLSLQSAAATEDSVSLKMPFDESPLTFDPSKYLPNLKQHWARQGGDASYALLTRCFILVNSTQSRIKIVDTLVNLIRTIIEGDPDSLLPMVTIHISQSTNCELKTCRYGSLRTRFPLRTYPLS